MELNGFHEIDFHEIRYVNIFRISIEKIRFPLISDNNNRYFREIPVYFFNDIFAEFFLE